MSTENNFLQAVYYNLFAGLQYANLPFVTVRTLAVDSQVQNPDDPTLFDIVISNYYNFDKTTQAFIVDMYGNHLSMAISGGDEENQLRITSPYYQNHDFDVLLINRIPAKTPQETKVLTYQFELEAITTKDPFSQINFEYKGENEIISARVYDESQSFECLFSSFIRNLSLYWQGKTFIGSFSVDLTVSATKNFVSTPKKLFLYPSADVIQEEDNALIQVDYLVTIYVTEVSVIDSFGNKQKCTFELSENIFNIRFPYFIQDTFFLIEATMGVI